MYAADSKTYEWPLREMMGAAWGDLPLPEAQQIVLALKYVAAEQDTPYSGDEMLFEILHFGWFGIPAFEVARLCAELAGRQFGDKKTSLRKLLQEKINAPARDLFSTPAHSGLHKASRLLEKWIAEAGAPGVPELLEQTIGEGDSITRGLQSQANEAVPGGPAPEIEHPERSFVTPLLERFAMNVSALNTYLRCPLEFYYKNIIRIPSPRNEAMGFGLAVHYALEQLFRKMLTVAGSDRQRVFPARDVFVLDFEWFMHRQRERFSKSQFEKRLTYGREAIGNYYNQYIHSFNGVVSVERMIRTVYEGIPIKGKIDKLEFDGKWVNIVDYKTGDPDKSIARMQPPNENDPNGGDYWRQAVFYKILVDNYGQKDWKAVSTEFDFIEPDKNKQYRREKLLITPADIATVGQQITRSWQQIQQHAFYTGCGKKDCHWCGFVKTNGLAINAPF